MAGFSRKDDKSIPSICGLTDQPAIPGHIWQQAGHRPAAHPQRRLLGMAYFISSLNSIYLYETFLEQGTRRKSINKLDQILTQLLSPAAPTTGNHSWGKSLVREMIGNVLIPALYYHAELSGSEGFTSYLEQYYFWLPATAFYGCLADFHNWPELSGLKNKFYIIQSLLTLQKNYCQLSLCHQCPLARIAESV